MSLLKPRRILAALLSIVLIMGGYLALQVYQGKQLAKQYGNKYAQTPDLKGTTPGTSSKAAEQSSAAAPPPSSSSTPSSPDSSSVPSSDSSSSIPSSNAPSTSGSSVASSTSTSGTLSSEDYKQLMATTYKQSLQTMQDVKNNTLALQGGNLSIAAYRSSIVQSQANFTKSEKFVRANPPNDQTLDPSYQEFTAGISLAKESMGVILDGISSFSIVKLYTARDMGKIAQKQVINGYSHFK